MKKLFIGLMLFISTLVFSADVIDIQAGINQGVADSNGSTHMHVNGSVTPVVFSAVPPAGESWEIHRIIGYLEGATTFDALTFGDLPALTNGVEIRINNILVGDIKNNLELALRFSAKDAPLILGKEKRALLGEWHFVQTFGKPVLVNSSQGGVSFTINDDLSGLNDYHVVVQGRKF